MKNGGMGIILIAGLGLWLWSQSKGAVAAGTGGSQAKLLAEAKALSAQIVPQKYTPSLPGQKSLTPVQQSQQNAYALSMGFTPEEIAAATAFGERSGGIDYYTAQGYGGYVAPPTGKTAATYETTPQWEGF